MRRLSKHPSPTNSCDLTSDKPDCGPAGPDDGWNFKGGPASGSRPATPARGLEIVRTLAMLIDVEPFDFDFAADPEAGQRLGDVDGDGSANARPDDCRDHRKELNP